MVGTKVSVSVPPLNVGASVTVGSSTTQEDPKHRVTMKSVRLDASGRTVEEQAVDYVPVSMLAAYVESANQRWQHVEVSEDIDYGPGGVGGDTVAPSTEGA